MTAARHRNNPYWLGLRVAEVSMAKSSTVAWAAFPNRDEAEQAIQRLSSAGFARNSIDLDPQRDGRWNVVVHTSERNLQRVDDLLHASTSMYAVREQSLGALEAVRGNPIVLAAAAVLGVAAVYSLLPRNRRLASLREFPSRIREVVQDLPETVRETARSVQETVSELPDTVREAVSTGTNRDTRRP
jgi:hypothetical protein